MKASVVRSTPPPGVPGLHKLGGVSNTAALLAGLLLLGVVAGMGWGAWLRRRGWAWTSGFMGLFPAVVSLMPITTGVIPLRAGLIVAAFPVGLAFGSAMWLIHEEIEDRRAGADREIVSADRKGVLDWCRRWAAERRALVEQALTDGLPVGRTSRGKAAMVGRGTKSAGRHVLIPGATGAGKTTSLAALLVDYVARSGFGAVVMEAKTDRALCEAAKWAAHKRGAPFYLFSPTGQSSYDPLAHGSVDERSERLIAVESWGSGDA
ncbi:MAG: hypothetical protein WBM00_01210, partial [Solirubrobacterales bacterium]